VIDSSSRYIKLLKSVLNRDQYPNKWYVERRPPAIQSLPLLEDIVLAKNPFTELWLKLLVSNDLLMTCFCYMLLEDIHYNDAIERR
jgi:hypothetical protein